MKKSAAKTWTISDLDGSNKREVTLAQFKAEHIRKCAEAQAIFEANKKKVRAR